MSTDLSEYGYEQESPMAEALRRKNRIKKIENMSGDAKDYGQVGNDTQMKIDPDNDGEEIDDFDELKGKMDSQRVVPAGTDDNVYDRKTGKKIKL